MEAFMLHGSRFPRYSALTLVELPPSLYSQITVTGSLLDQPYPRYVWFLLTFASTELPVPVFVGVLTHPSTREAARVVPPAAQQRTAEGTGQNHKTYTVVRKKKKKVKVLFQSVCAHLTGAIFSETLKLEFWSFLGGEPRSGGTVMKSQMATGTGVERTGCIFHPASPAVKAAGRWLLQQHGAGGSAFHLPVIHLAEEETSDSTEDVEVAAVPLPCAKGAPMTVVYKGTASCLPTVSLHTQHCSCTSSG